MTPDFCSPILYKIRQGAAEGATSLVVPSGATQNTGKKTSKIVDFILSGAPMKDQSKFQMQQFEHRIRKVFAQRRLLRRVSLCLFCK